jgi:hypothetical protein
MRDTSRLAISYLLMLSTLRPSMEKMPLIFGAPVVTIGRQGRFTVARLLVLVNGRLQESFGVAARKPSDDEDETLGENLAIWRACKRLLSADEWV